MLSIFSVKADIKTGLACQATLYKHNKYIGKPSVCILEVSAGKAKEKRKTDHAAYIDFDDNSAGKGWVRTVSR